MKRGRLSSFTSRALIPLCRDSMSSITSSTVSPVASTDFCPPVCDRRMVGMDTVTAIGLPPLFCLSRLRLGLDDPDRLLGDDTVDDAVRTEFVLVGVPGRHQDVMRIRLRR